MELGELLFVLPWVEPEPLELEPEPEEPVLPIEEPELPAEPELLPVALPAELSPELEAMPLERVELDSAIASCCVPEPLITTSSIEPIF